MTKNKKSTVFFCQNCGYESAKWMGQCPGCREWNTFVEEQVSTAALKKNGTQGSTARQKPAVLSEITMEKEDRISTGMQELDRVLGGGVVAGSLTLVGGDPGIGKSTLLLQVCRNFSDAGHNVLYISGEESLKQIKMRAERIGSFNDHLSLLCETNLSLIEETIRNLKPQIVIIDSIQTMYSEEVSAAPGSVSQVRESTGLFLQLAKGLGVSIFIVGHVTKEGTVAGPRVLEHMVDTVLYFEGDRYASYRILRSVKNRFGSTNEIGVFEMMDSGLKEVENPSEMLLSGRPTDAPGTCVTCAMEGARPVLAEVQALVAPAAGTKPLRSSNGFDYNRASMLLAVLEKRGGLKISQCDTYLNIIGGLTLEEPAADLAAVIAIASSYLDKAVPDDMAAVGEIGLSGEVRSINHLEQRLSEVQRLGFTQCMVPAHRAGELKPLPGLTLLPVENIAQALRLLVKGK